MAKQLHKTDKFGRRLPLGPRPKNLPSHDRSGRKLPLIFKVNRDKPKGKEIRVIVKDGNSKPSFTTFEDMKDAQDFINNSNNASNINRKVTLEFGNGKKVGLKLGQKVKP